MVSSSDSSTPICAFAHLDTIVSSSFLNTRAFLAWLSADTGDPSRLLRAKPEGYLIADWASRNSTMGLEIIESLGGHITHFAMPDFGKGGKKTFMADLPNYPHQLTGQFIERCNSICGFPCGIGVIKQIQTV